MGSSNRYAMCSIYHNVCCVEVHMCARVCVCVCAWYAGEIRKQPCKKRLFCKQDSVGALKRLSKITLQAARFQIQLPNHSAVA